jgi:hypothetical protein
MGYGPVVNGKQLPITKWKGSWAHQEFQKRCEAPWYSSLHKQWVVRHPDKPELVVARGRTEGDLKWDGYLDTQAARA